MLKIAMRGTIRLLVEVPKRVSGLLTAPTLAVLVGAGLLIWGLRMVYEPLAYIVPGGALTGFGALVAMRAARGGDE